MEESAFLNSFQSAIATESSESHFPKDDLKTLFAIATKYRTLHEVGKLVASEMEIEALLRLAMDKVIEVTRAQRGFIALIEEKNKLDFKVARNLEKSDIDQPHFQVSRSVIEKALATGETICLRDAMADAMYGNAESVLRLQLLSVLCTPLKIADRIAGVIYVDNSNVKQLFDEAVADLLAAFAEQIAIALKNARVFSDLKKSHQQLANELRAHYQGESAGTGDFSRTQTARDRKIRAR